MVCTTRFQKLLQLHSVKYDEKALIATSKKIFKMTFNIGFYELMQASNITLQDDHSHYTFMGKRVPKDHFMDGVNLHWLVWDATTERNNAVQVTIPALTNELAMLPYEEQFELKNRFDEGQLPRVNNELGEEAPIWGGVFQTTLDDWENEDNTDVELPKLEGDYYHNIVLAARDIRAFNDMTKAEGLADKWLVRDCKGCPAKEGKHRHALAMDYPGVYKYTAPITEGDDEPAELTRFLCPKLTIADGVRRAPLDTKSLYQELAESLNYDTRRLFSAAVTAGKKFAANISQPTPATNRVEALAAKLRARRDSASSAAADDEAPRDRQLVFANAAEAVKAIKASNSLAYAKSVAAHPGNVKIKSGAKLSRSLKNAYADAFQQAITLAVANEEGIKDLINHFFVAIGAPCAMSATYLFNRLGANDNGLIDVAGQLCLKDAPSAPDEGAEEDYASLMD